MIQDMLQLWSSVLIQEQRLSLIHSCQGTDGWQVRTSNENYGSPLIIKQLVLSYLYSKTKGYLQVFIAGIYGEWYLAAKLNLPEQGLDQGWQLVHVAGLAGHPAGHVDSISAELEGEAVVVIDLHPQPERGHSVPEVIMSPEIHQFQNFIFQSYYCNFDSCISSLRMHELKIEKFKRVIVAIGHKSHMAALNDVQFIGS